MCLDETLAWCELPPGVLEFDLAAHADHTEVGSTPLALVTEVDRPLAISALMRARSQGIADVAVRFEGNDDHTVVHIVNMLTEWGVVVMLVGGVSQTLPDDGTTAPHRPLPRRLVHHRDGTGHILWVDDATEQLLGWTHAEMLGRSAIVFVDPADQERALAGWVDMLGGGRIERSRLRYLTPGGERRWLEVTAKNLLHDPDAGYVEVELIDVHAEMIALSAAKFGEAQFGALTESLPVGVIQVDADGVVAHVNRWMRDLTGMTIHDSTRHAGIVAEDRTIVDRAFDAAIAKGESTDVDARLISASTGEQRHCRLRVRPLGSDDDGHSLGAIASIEDVTETEALHRRLHAQVRTDGLTGVGNRFALNEWLGEHLAAPDGGDGVTLFYFDLDGFKHVNDRHGHAAGDHLLRAIATDVAHSIGPRDLLARIGGDEFVVATPRLIDDRQCERRAADLLDIVDRGIDVGGAVVTVSCSIGIARSSSADAGALVLADADHAMYHAKRNGGHRWTISTDAFKADPTGDT